MSLAYLLTLIALLVPAGRLSDAHGRKLLYLYGLVVFTAASAACGLAPNLVVLIGCRVVQAAGAAMLQANSVALVTTSAPANRRRDALGAQAGAQALGLALGPTVGGILVSTVGWRWVFFINVPVGVVALVAGYYLLPRTRQRNPMAAVDLVSVGLLAAASTGLLLGMSAASGLSISGLGILGCLLLTALAGWAFWDRQRRLAGRVETRPGKLAAPNPWPQRQIRRRFSGVEFAGSRLAEPLIDLGLFRDPVISWGLVGALCGYFILFGPLVLVPVVLEARGVSVLASGLILTALPAGFAVAAVAGAAVLPHGLDERRRATLGAVICSAALLTGLMVTFTTASLLPVLALVGMGLGVFTPSNNSMIMGAVPMEAAATGGGLLNLTRGLGTALGVAAVTLALHLGSSRTLPLPGDRLAVLSLLAAAMLAVVASWVGPRRRWPPLDARGRTGP